MNEMLDTIVFGGYTAQDVLIVLGVVIACSILLRMVMQVFRKNGKDKYNQLVDCPSCGWHGNVSRLAGHCPRCNQPLGDQKARQFK